MNGCVFTLVVFLMYPSGKIETTMRPIFMQESDIDRGGKSMFDACLFEGQKSAAKYWGHVPGLRFRIVCTDPRGHSIAIGAEASGGHPGLSFRAERRQ